MNIETVCLLQNIIRKLGENLGERISPLCPMWSQKFYLHHVSILDLEISGEFPRIIDHEGTFVLSMSVCIRGWGGISAETKMGWKCL